MADPRFKHIELKVGLFIFASIVMIFVMIIGFLITQDVFTRKVKVVFHAQSGEGLSKSMPVMYSGFQIARVHNIELRDDGVVELRSNIPERYKKWVKSDTEAKIQAQGVIGANAIVLSGGTLETPMISDGQTYTLKRDKAISDILEKVEPMIDDIRQILINVDNVTTSISDKRSDIESLLTGVGAVGSDLENKTGSVGYLVRSDYLKNEVAQIIAKVKQIEDNIEKITIAVNSRVDETQPVIQSFDKGLIAIKEGSEKIGNLAKDLNDTVNSLEPTITNTNKITSDVSETTTNLADIRKETDEILNTTNRILLNLEEKWPFDSGSGVSADEKVNLP
jgi:phospholipid/cholesterol/gamma-HCH transport system substrate-binding protein